MAVKDDITLILLNELAQDVKEAIQFIMRSKLNNKVNKATIGIGSSLHDDLYVDTTNMQLAVYIYDYYKYVESGRKKGAKKIPIAVLLKWMIKKRIKPKQPRNKKTGRFMKKPSIQQLAFMIQNAIVRDGIKGRPFMQEAFDFAFTITSNKIEQEIFEKYINESIIKGIKLKR